ncbi:PREDICTED: uncharacterized protein LOC106726051, partial [Myotis brandtii]|uniref:uncharacterized protein LOC106726051 n=1 Tax=Myotis brandtii TaxID=109478 RepID=UPI0007045379
MTFLRAVDTLASAVRTQANGSMNNYIPKTLLAKKIETLMLEEGGGELLTSSVRQQAMLSIVALRFPLRPPLRPWGPPAQNTGLGGRARVWGCWWQGPMTAPSSTSIRGGGGTPQFHYWAPQRMWFFREFLIPEERMDAIMVFMEAMASDREDNVKAASKILRMTLRSSMPEIGKATRAMHELLLEPSRRMEVQMLFPPLFMALLIQTSFLVVEGGAEAAGSDEHVTKWMDPLLRCRDVVATVDDATTRVLASWF